MGDNTSASDVISLQGVSKRYIDRMVVSQIDLDVREGERFALLGHNGAGKTTLFKLILGLCRPTEGEIVVQGRNIVTTGRRQANVGYLPESVSFQDSMTGREVIRFYAGLKRRSREECDKLLDRVGLDDVAGQSVRTYSKGMRQRLGLAQAMLGDPSLMLLDEPTTGLDPVLRSMFYDIIEQRAAVGSTTLISSHALTEIETSVDRVAIMKNGSLVACGSLEDLRRRASLPTRIRLHVPAGGTAAVVESLRDKVDIHRVNERTVDLSCTEDEKLRILRYIGSMNEPILDVEIAPVRLEQLYKYFTAGEEENQ